MFFVTHNNTKLLKYSAIIHNSVFAVSAHGTHLLAKSKSDLEYSIVINMRALAKYELALSLISTKLTVVYNNKNSVGRERTFSMGIVLGADLSGGRVELPAGAREAESAGKGEGAASGSCAPSDLGMKRKSRELERREPRKRCASSSRHAHVVSAAMATFLTPNASTARSRLSHCSVTE